MKKITHIKSLTFLIACFCAVSFGYGQIVAWEMNGNAGNEATVNATTLDGNLNTSALSRGSGVNPSTFANAFSSTSFTLNGTQVDAITNSDYLQFQVSASAGFQVSLSTLDATFRRSNTGPNTFLWRYSTDGVNFTDIGSSISYTVNVGDGTAQTQINLSTILALQNVSSGTTITIRLYGWGATNTVGTFAIGRLGGNDLSIGGSVSALPTCAGTTTTWNGSSWDNGAPDITTPAVLNDNYNTFLNGSFSACNLTVNNTSALTVSDNTYIEIQNEITVDVGSSINVRPYGSVIQNNDINNNVNNGTIQVVKKTSLLAAWYEYTYWSSPVSGTTIGNALTDSDVGRRFSYNAANFEDVTMETGNNNATVLGQDDIDDNGDDWTFVNGATIMAPGVGYASTHEESVFIGPGSPPYQFDYSFTGDFNNGIITVPVVRNDVSGIDENWNFIGNPYPSAISVSDFFAQNIYDATTNPTGTLEGAIYYWSQNTPPSGTANGNQQLNFATSDYAIRNGVTGTLGGDGVTPNAFIPSGQGFFISFAQARPSSSGNVIFNNSMRGITNDNSQFFKDSNSKKTSNNSTSNKLWVNLTSDNGVFNQIAIGYVDGATNAYDGAFYDAHKIVAPSTFASLYSNIENSTKKFAIQGKAVDSLNENEIINIGFKTTINVPTLFKLSIANFEGDFLTNNTIYLKDNLLNKTHDLSASDYTFTSEVGEFNNRFQIGFNAQALSNDEFEIAADQLSIVELENDNIQFKISNNSTIKSVSIFDLLGRQLYSLKGQNSTETYRFSNLNSSIFIAKVELSNGLIITKKAVKN